MLSDLASVIPGIGGDEKKDEEGDVLLNESANVPIGLLAIRVFGCTNLYLDKEIIPDHYGLYADITIGFSSKCTSVQSCFKKGKVIWDEVKNFSVAVSPKISSGLNKVHIAIIGFDKQQNRPKYRLLGKIEFHLHKIVKKQWSMDSFELQNKKKRYAGDISIEFAFAYGTFGYGLSEQIENVHTPKEVVDQSAFPRLDPPGTNLNILGVSSIPQKVTHPKFIPFTVKVLNLEPDISPTYELRTVPLDIFKTRPAMDQKLTRLKQSCADYAKLTSRAKRISYLKKLMSKEETERSTLYEIVEQESDSDGDEEEANVGLREALAQMAHMSFLGGDLGSANNKQGTKMSVITEENTDRVETENQAMTEQTEMSTLHDALSEPN